MFWSILGSILIIAFFLQMIIGWTIYFVMWFKCHKKHKCLNENCKFRTHCDRTELTENERKRIIELLEEMSELD